MTVVYLFDELAARAREMRAAQREHPERRAELRSREIDYECHASWIRNKAAGVVPVRSQSSFAMDGDCA